MTSPELAEQVRLLRDGIGAVRIDRDVVRAEGDAAVDYLQGQLSQDVAAMAVGSSAWSFVLQPQGKVDVWFRVTRTSETTFVLDTDPGWGDALVARLERFRLRTAVTFERLDWSAVALRGADVPVPDAPADGLVVAVDRPGERGWDVLDAQPSIPPGVPQCSPEALEVLRIEAGVPRMGAELDGSTIPAEAGVVPISVSFTKGCYTGQELVARIDSRGSTTPRRLVGVRIDGQVAPTPGTALLVEGRDVGRVTSASAGGAHGGAVALGYLVRAVATPVAVELGGSGTTGTATDLPLADG